MITAQIDLVLSLPKNFYAYPNVSLAHAFNGVLLGWAAIDIKE